MRTLVQAPLPQWRDVIAAMFGAVSDLELAAPWLRPGESAFWFSRSAWSLAAIAKWRLRLTVKQAVHVWLPDYFCNATLAPLREMGAKLVFYPVSEQMAPDLEACHRLAKQQPIDLFVLVHYFGQAIPVEPFADFCEQHRAWLIEDAAHVLQPVPGVGEFGDCVVYSPHKHLPIPNGAVMVVRPNGPAQLDKIETAMQVLDEVRASMLSLPGKSSRRAMLWLLKRLAQQIGMRSYPRPPAFNAELEPREAVSCHPQMSAIAKRLLKPLGSRLQAVAADRTQNAYTWRAVLTWTDTKADLKHWLPTATPYLARFSVGSMENAKLLFNRLQKVNLLASTWPDLPPEVVNDREAHSVAISLRHTCLYLPVHQSLTERHMLAFGKALAKNTTEDWNVRLLSQEEWEEFWQACAQTNLLQSWQYGAAKQEAEGWQPHRLLVSNAANQPVALVQALTKGIPLLGHVARINRGPLLLNNKPEMRNECMLLLAIKALLDFARSKRWRMVQMAPELSQSSCTTIGLRTLGFKRVSGEEAWRSGRLSLNRDELDLLMGLKGKWRNALRKGEKLGVTVVCHHEVKEGFEALIQSYTDLQEKKGFEGLSLDILRAMAKQSGNTWEFNLFTAYLNASEDARLNLGHLVTIRSGDTALYLIGSVNEKGRQCQANSVLLWRAILHAKKSGCIWFDIGGVSSELKGVTDFKLGINADEYILAGEWRKWL